jgi:predicted permease
MNSFFRKLQWLARRRDKEAELREELQFHLAEEAELRQAEGMAEEEAQYAARRELGNVTLVAEDTRAAWGWTLLDQLGQDLRYTFRTIAANRLFTLLAVSSLALGIGANTAIYSFMDSILLRSLPVSDPDSLVMLNWNAKTIGRDDFVMHNMSGSTWSDPKGGVVSGMFPYPAFELARKSEVFSSVFGYYQSRQSSKLNVTIDGRADVGTGQLVTGDFFRGLAVAPAAGRLIAPDDDTAGASNVAVVSHAFSERHLGGVAAAPGRQILINNLPFTVTGVTPPGFFGVDPAINPDVYLPMHANELLGAADQFGFRPERYLDGNFYWIQIMARLSPGVTREQAQAALAPVFQRWALGTATTDKQRANLPGLVLEPGAGGLDSLRRKYSQPLYVLLAMVGLILALACANTANLVLVRAAARRREVALRLSIGASRARIVRQLLTESVTLSLLGGCLGILFAVWGIRFLTLLLSNGLPNFTLRAELNWHVLAAAAALSVFTGVLFGLAPALQATRIDVIPALRETRTGLPRGRRVFGRVTLSHIFVVSQIAISMIMLVAAGLFARTLSNLQAIDVGFDTRNVLLFQVDAVKAGRRGPEIAAFYGGLRRRLATIPGVRNVSLSADSLIQAGYGLPIGLAGQPPSRSTRILTVGPEFFASMRIPVLAGRDFEERDQPGSQPVAIVNEEFVKTHCAGRNPIGQHVTVRKDQRVERDMEIIGVTRNVRYGSLTRNTPPVVYLAYNQGYPEPAQMVYSLQTAGDPLRYVAAVREVVRLADARLPISDIRTQQDDIDHTINREITFARLCGGFASLALLIACVGLYGAVSYNVARRTGEIGIRMALGAPRGGVVRMVLGEVLLLASAGLAIGFAAALATSRFLESFLYGMKPNDPLSLSAAAATLLGAALLAGYVPARKASRIDPMTAVRHE